MSTPEDHDTDKSSNHDGDDLERKVGGAEIQPPAELVLPQPPPTTQPCAAMGVSSRPLDRRLNPNAPVFVPEFKAKLLATKLYDGLAPYTRWSSASSDDISYGPRFDSIWREFSVEQMQPPDPHFVEDSYEELVDLELDEHQAMNIGAESYDPQLSRSATNPVAHSEVQVIEIVGDIQPQLQQTQDQPPAEELNNAKDFQSRYRYPRSGATHRRCCIIM